MLRITFTVRVAPAVKKRLVKLTKTIGHSRSLLVAQALNEYFAVNEWQVAGIKRAMAALDRSVESTHQETKRRVNSWDRKRERLAPRRPAWQSSSRPNAA